MPRRFGDVRGDESGAVAATVAVSLFALIAVGGIAFDYARMAAMDTELQNAADQAALAGATQLDGASGTCARAAAAAVAFVANQTLFANDGDADGISVVIPNEATCDAVGQIKFWQDRDATTAADEDSEAHFIEVTVNSRTAKFAFTPVVAAFNSGGISATAMAGLGSAMCKVPPLMICNPQETALSPAFNIASLVGKGIKMLAVGNQGNQDALEAANGPTWAPGNFGYLNNGNDEANALVAIKKELGWNIPPGDCLEISGVNTKTGAITPVTHALNTRFDIYEDSGPEAACVTGGTCQPSTNAAKDLVRKANATGANSCGLGNNAWTESSSPYLPASATVPLTTAQMPKTMGHPRDMCHAVSNSGSCTSGRIGDGLWDRNAYFTVNYPGLNWTAAMTAEYGTTSVTRYQVYRWEASHGATTFTDPDGNTRTVAGSRNVEGSGANLTLDHNGPVCSGSGIAPSSSADRRRLSAAVVNCIENGVNGSSTGVPVKDWIDLFLVEPSFNRTRTARQDIYVEVIGSNGVGSADNQVIRRDVPYLVR